MTDRELLNKAIYWFKVIAEDMERITTGNLPHCAATTKGMAIRAYEFLEKHKEETVSEELEKIVEEIAEPTILNAYGTKELARRLRNTICGTSVSEELNNAAVEWFNSVKYKSDLSGTPIEGFKAGAQWKKEHIWKPADGDDLPEYDREVIVLVKYSTQRNIHDKEYPTYRVGFGHRPNPNGWDGKNIDTNEVTHYTPKLYDKGGWNAPDIAYWLDVRLPKEIEL